MQLAKIDTQATMSSREIAELTGKEHHKVKLDIENMFAELKTDNAGFRAIYLDAMNRSQTEYILSKEYSLCVVSGYSVKMRMAIIKRWQELEAKQAPQIPQTYAAALLEAGRLALIVEEQGAKIQSDAPKVKFAEAVRALDGSCDVESFAKALGTGRNRLFKWLRDNKYLMVTRMPYQQYVDRGLFVVIEQTPYTDSEGKSHPTFKTMITGKGQVWLENKFNGGNDANLSSAA